MIFFPGFLCLCLLLTFISFFQKLWWNPIMLQKKMKRQGIRGPSYKFMYGNTKDISGMRKKSVAKSADIHSHQVFSRIHPEIQTWAEEYGLNYLFWRGPEPELAVTQLDLIKEILNNKDGAYGKGQQALFIKKLLGDGVLMTDGEKWTKLRKLSNHAFHGDSLKGMIPTMIEGVDLMLRRWGDSLGQEIEVYEDFRQLTAEVISRTAFGSSYLEGKNIFNMLTKLVLLAGKNKFEVQIPILSKLRKNKDEVEADKLNAEIRKSVERMIKAREEDVKLKEEGSFDDFLGSLVKAKNDDDVNRRITMEDMVDECKTFYFAGQETTNSLLAWTIYLLALHQDWQDEVRREVTQLCGQKAPNSDSLSKLKTMTMVINESSRLYPPVVAVARQVNKNVKCGSLILPADMKLFISTLASHYNPDIWGQDVHLFKPKRFAEGVAKATNNNIAAFMPFSLGPRNCVGSTFAMTEAKITLSMILQRFSFRLSPTYVHSPYIQLTLYPQYGIQVVFQPL